MIKGFYKNEQWKTIEGFSNYEVSNTGKVRNKKTKRILKGTPSARQPYLCVGLKEDNSGKRVTLRIHRLVALAFIPYMREDLFVDHIDNNKTNNHVGNLRPCTNRQNLQHYHINKGKLKGFIGVTEKDGKFEANKKIAGKKYYLGRYNTPQEAQKAYYNFKTSAPEY